MSKEEEKLISLDDKQVDFIRSLVLKNRGVKNSIDVLTLVCQVVENVSDLGDDKLSSKEKLDLAHKISEEVLTVVKATGAVSESDAVKVREILEDRETFDSYVTTVVNIAHTVNFTHNVMKKGCKWFCGRCK